MASVKNPMELEHDFDEKRRSGEKIATGYAVSESAKVSAQKAAVKYARPDSYTGNRSLYDSGSAKRQAKESVFQNGAKVVDSYTGKELVLTKKEAKLRYGENWQQHLAESDHIEPLERIVDESKTNPWLTAEDINQAANSKDNLSVTSRKFNNAKRSRTNEEFVTGEGYLVDKGIALTDKGKQNAITDAENARRKIKQKLEKSSIGNAVKTGHDAGTQAAKNAGGTTATISFIRNACAVVNGEKDARDAVKDTLLDTGKAAATGYVMGNGLVTVSHTLSNTSSKFIQALNKSNVPGKVITAVMATGNTLKRYGMGEITTEECLLELGESGLGMVTTGYSMAVGQALIPIPVVGAAVGAFVGSVMTGKYYHQLVDLLKEKELEHQERLRIIEECNMAAEQARTFQNELEAYLEGYFREYRDCFDSALSEIHFACQTGDIEGIVDGANQITRKLGGKVYYETKDEFDDFLDDDTVFVL